MKFDLSTRRPVGSSQVNCEIAQRVNNEILSWHAPEDKELVSQVIAHTTLCDVCRGKFLAGRPGVKKENTDDEGDSRGD